MSTQMDRLESPAFESCKSAGWKRQFGNPAGAMGAAVGHLMAVKNRAMYRYAVEMLDVQPEDRVLEIGFGHGKAVQMAANRAVRGKVCGIDRSDVMLKQASRLNRAAMAGGRVELRRGTVSRLPFVNGTFTKVFEVNTFHHWPSQENDLGEIRRVLKEGGLLLLCLRMKPQRKWLAPPGYNREQIEGVKALLERVGFRRVYSRLRDLGGEKATVVAATK